MKLKVRATLLRHIPSTAKTVQLKTEEEDTITASGWSLLCPRSHSHISIVHTPHTVGVRLHNSQSPKSAKRSFDARLAPRPQTQS